MKTVLVALIAGAAATAPCPALVPPPHAAPAAVRAPPATPATPDNPPGGPDEARIHRLLTAGDSLQALGRFGPSRRQYQTLIAEQRSAMQYPDQALWRLANSYYGQGDELEAASVLDELAQAASQFGDPATELRATFEAAVMYQRHNQAERVAPKIQRVRALLRSPVIDDNVKKEIQARMEG